MGIHRDCGAEIEWPRREDDPERYGRPLEFAGQAYILTEEGYAIRVLTYKSHECDPNVMAEWLERCRRIEELRQENAVTTEAMYEAEREIQRESQWKIAFKVKCSRCSAPRNKKCKSMAKHEHGRILKRPHPERLRLSEEKYGVFQ